MKTLLATLTILFSCQCYAVSWKVYGPCSKRPVHAGTTILKDAKISVGAFSLQVFDSHGIPYIGSELGFNSIIGTPTDRGSIEIVSKDEIRAYGWCYSVDGKFPERMPHEVFFDHPEAELVWFYAYSTIKNNQWQGDYCSPAYNIKAPQFCGKK